MQTNTQHAAAEQSYQFETLPHYADVNPGRHVSALAIQDLYVEARMQFQLNTMKLPPWFPDQFLLRPVNVSSTFLRSGAYPAALRCAVTLAAASASMYRIDTDLWQDDACIGSQECWMTAWGNGVPIALPPQVIARLPVRDAGIEPVRFEQSADPRSYPFHLEISLRYGDHDADGCIGEATIANYAEQARAQFMEALFGAAGIDAGGDSVGLLVARTSIDFRSYRPAQGNHRPAVGVSRVGRSSFALRIGIFDSGGCRAVVDTVAVCASAVGGRPLPIPSALRRELEHWTCHAPDTTL